MGHMYSHNFSKWTPITCSQMLRISAPQFSEISCRSDVEIAWYL